MPEEKKHNKSIVLILGLAFLLRMVHLYIHLSSPLGHVEKVFTYSDIHAFHVWAERIARGDWLSRDTYHPYMDWMKPIAPLEDFVRLWGNGKVFHQAPLYPYLLGLSYLVFGSNVPLLLFQVCMTVLAIYLLFRMGERLHSRGAGLFAALVASLFPPSILYDSILLRASLICSSTIIAVWLAIKLKDQPKGKNGLKVGLFFGLCFRRPYDCGCSESLCLW